MPYKISIRICMLEWRLVPPVNKTKFFRWADLLLILVIFLAALAIFLPKQLQSRSQKLTAVVTQDGKEIERIDLSKVSAPYTIPLRSHPAAVLEVGPGYIRYLKANCKDQICVRTGKLTKAGDTAVCLPAKTSVRLEAKHAAGSKSNPDIITW